MGSFNVACSISGISIKAKQQVRYLLLLPNKVQQHNVHKLTPTNGYLYQDDLFKPFALPIAGTYNDGGSIENIVRDSNTAIIEERFGLTIEEIADGIHRKESFYFPRSPFFSRVVQEDKQQSFRTMMFDEKLALEEFGFVQKGDFWVHPKQSKFKIKFDTKTFHFGIYKGTQIVFESPQITVLSQALGFIYEQTGVFLGVADEDQQIAAELFSLSAMFIHEDIYKALSDSTIDSIREEALPAEEFKSQVQKLGELLVQHEDVYQRLLAVHSDKKTLKQMKALGMTPTEMIPRNMYEMLGTDEYRAVQAFENMPLFMETYRHKLFVEEIAQQLFDFYYFKWAMRGMNKMYFPAMNGEQGANNAATLYLAQITQQIVQ